MAQSFKDASERTWLVPVNVATIKRTKQLLDVNLLDVVADKGELMQQLATDPILLCNVLYCVCKDQADAQGISDYQFGELLYGDVLEQAAVALLEGLTDFFPSGKRKLLRTALAKLNAYQTQIIDKLQTRLESPALAQHIEAQIEKDFAALNKSLAS